MYLSGLKRFFRMPKLQNRHNRKFVENLIAKHHRNAKSPYTGRAGARRLVRQFLRGERGEITLCLIDRQDYSFELMSMTKERPASLLGPLERRAHTIVSWSSGEEPSFFLKEFQPLLPVSL